MTSHTEIRASLSSIGESTPSSDVSESIGSDSYHRNSDWTHRATAKMHRDDLSADIPAADFSGILSEAERVQIESFFSSLGTEVSALPLSLGLLIVHERDVNQSLRRHRSTVD